MRGSSFPVMINWPVSIERAYVHHTSELRSLRRKRAGTLIEKRANAHQLLTTALPEHSVKRVRTN